MPLWHWKCDCSSCSYTLVLKGAAQRLVSLKHLGSLPGGWESHLLADLADSAAAQVFHAWLKAPLHPGFSTLCSFPCITSSLVLALLVFMSQMVRDSEPLRPERLPHISTLIFYNRQTTGVLWFSLCYTQAFRKIYYESNISRTGK